MTPLNSIIANSKIMEKRVNELVEKASKSQNMADQVTNKITKQLVKQIEYSGKIMFFYN